MERGTIVTVFIICYALTSFVGGYVSGGYYARNEGKNWIQTMLITACLFPIACFSIAFVLNTIAIFYQVRKHAGAAGGPVAHAWGMLDVEHERGGQRYRCSSRCRVHAMSAVGAKWCTVAIGAACIVRCCARGHWLPCSTCAAVLRSICQAAHVPPLSPFHAAPQSLAAVPFGSIVIVLLIWMFISFPLCLFGTVVGRNWAGAPDHPCR